LPRVEIIGTEEPLICTTCHREIPAGRFCAEYGEEHFCGPDCVDSHMEKQVGRDFIAAQDQAIAAAHEVLDFAPKNFVLLYSLDGESIVTNMLAIPDFVAACVPVLIRATQLDGNVEPPEMG